MNKNVENIPNHVAIIMDGNRRWAKKRGLSVIAGHKKVVTKIVEELIDEAGKKGISYITLWVFSTENWNRGNSEVRGMMSLFRMALDRFAKKMVDKGARLLTIGDLSKFPKDIYEGMNKWMEKSKNNKKITVIFALNYGGREEILMAINKLIEKRVVNNKLKKEKEKEGKKKKEYLGNNVFVNKKELEKYLYTNGIPDVDLIIRPGGEKRLSGFMLWQSEYSELYFSDVLMPDFSAKEFNKALSSYKMRKRRFGAG